MCVFAIMGTIELFQVHVYQTLTVLLTAISVRRLTVVYVMTVIHLIRTSINV
jgi:hypothetical protein